MKFLNKISCLFVSVCNIMLIILYVVFRLLGLLSFSAMHILLVVSVFSIIMDVIFYRRNPESDNYKYVIFIM